MKTWFEREFGSRKRRGVYIKDAKLQPGENVIEMDGEEVTLLPVTFSDHPFATVVEKFLRQEGYTPVRNWINPLREPELWEEFVSIVFPYRDPESPWKPDLVVILVPEDELHMAIIDLSEAGAYR
jgi:hypothetical protein